MLIVVRLTPGRNNRFIQFSIVPLARKGAGLTICHYLQIFLLTLSYLFTSKLQRQYAQENPKDVIWQDAVGVSA